MKNTDSSAITPQTDPATTETFVSDKQAVEGKGIKILIHKKFKGEWFTEIKDNPDLWAEVNISIEDISANMETTGQSPVEYLVLPSNWFVTHLPPKYKNLFLSSVASAQD